MKGEVLLT